MIDGIVLDVQLRDAELLCEPRGAHERREPGIEAGLGLFDRQELLVAPQRSRPRFDQLPADDRADRRVVVRDLEGTQAVRADPHRLGWVDRATQMTSQSSDEFHRALPCADASAPGSISDDWCTPSVLIVAGQPARSYVDFNSCSRREKSRRASSATEGPAPERNAPRISGSSSARDRKST